MNRNGPHGEDVTPGHQGRRDRRFLAWCQARSGRAADNLAGRPALQGAAETTNRFSTGVRPPTQRRSGASLSVLPCANSGVTAVLTVTGLMERPGRNDRPSCDLGRGVGSGGSQHAPGNDRPEVSSPSLPTTAKLPKHHLPRVLDAVVSN